MKKTVELDREYKCSAAKAVEKFFKLHPELEEWQEIFEWMAESGTEHYMDEYMADGTKNQDWMYSLWLEEDESWYDGKTYTYIAIILREEN